MPSSSRLVSTCCFIVHTEVEFPPGPSFPTEILPGSATLQVDASAHNTDDHTFPSLPLSVVAIWAS